MLGRVRALVSVFEVLSVFLFQKYPKFTKFTKLLYRTLFESCQKTGISGQNISSSFTFFMMNAGDVKPRSSIRDVKINWFIPSNHNHSQRPRCILWMELEDDTELIL